ncbi:MAG: flagellar biosynthesis protein FlhA [Chitinivorax sp.]
MDNKARPTGALTAAFGRYSDLALAMGVVMIIALMVLPLPHWLIDMLVAVNISSGLALLLFAIYVPNALAFSSFPSVLLITTLFRLALSIATTRQILLEASAGHIIDTFGNMVAGGNLVVGIVVFLIITVVQFIVIAKGAERVAEVSARFTLDAMPGKQLSIDSDLRSGLIDRDEAKRKRRVLEEESQLHGALDGAMKFVKGDAIAGIIIIVVNLLGGLAIGLLQRDMTMSDAMHSYSILTIGEGMVAQIPALLGAMAAGLIVARGGGDEARGNLGTVIGLQFLGQPKALFVTGLIVLLMMLVPGFPAPVFALLGASLLLAAWHTDRQVLQGWIGAAPQDAQSDDAGSPADGGFIPALPLSLQVPASALEMARGAAQQSQRRVSDELGFPLPPIDCRANAELPPAQYQLLLFGAPLLSGPLPTGTAALVEMLQRALRRSPSQFLGIQEVSHILEKTADYYPELVKETMRALPTQRVVDVMRALIDEGVSIRNQRGILECLSERGLRENDVVMLIEQVRQALRRQISARYAGHANSLHAILAEPATEDQLRSSVQMTPFGSALMLAPEPRGQLLAGLQTTLAQVPADIRPHLVLLASSDIRPYLARLLKGEIDDLPVVAYQELMPDVTVTPQGALRFEELVDAL